MEYVFLGKESLSAADDGGNEEVAVNAAFANFNKAIAICPDCTDAMVEKAMLLVRLKRTSDAEVLFKKILKFDKNDAAVNYGLGLICKMNKKPAEALKYLRRALKVAPTSPRVHNQLAEIYENIGLDDKAEEHRELARRFSREK